MKINIFFFEEFTFLFDPPPPPSTPLPPVKEECFGLNQLAPVKEECFGLNQLAPVKEECFGLNQLAPGDKILNMGIFSDAVSTIDVKLCIMMEHWLRYPFMLDAQIWT